MNASDAAGNRYRPFIQSNIINDISQEQSSNIKTPNSSCFKLIKWIFITFNLFLLLCGCSLLGYGIWKLTTKWYFLYIFTGDIFQVASITLVVTGCVTLMIGLMGYISVITRNKSLITTYIVLMLMVFMFEAILGLMTYVPDNTVTVAEVDKYHDILHDAFIDQYGADVRMMEAVDIIQQQFSCCGVSGYSDWSRHNNTSWSKTRGSRKVPDSCCKSLTPGCGVRDHPSNIAYSGCIHSFSKHIHGHLYIVTLVSFGVCLLLVVGVLITTCLLGSWQNEKENKKKKLIMIQGYWRTK